MSCTLHPGRARQTQGTSASVPKTARGKKLLPAGAVLWAWEADPDFDEPAGEQWLTLLPAKFNEQVWYGWRLDPRELVKAPAEQPGAAQTREGQQEGRRGC